MQRYSLITEKFPREFLLLQGTGCRWKKCTFCDYYDDASDSPFETNRKVLEQVTGKYGVLDIINSGSAMELDDETIELIKEIVVAKEIKTIWFEAHYMYRNRLQEFARQFAPATVKFRCGVESFDATLRSSWAKGIPASVTAADVAKYFKGICLLCCTVGDSKERIIRDIATAKEHFEYFSVNLFCNNTTPVKRDEELAAWFVKELYPTLKTDRQIEVLVENSDLGVG
ncbi:MAG: hypothetical protein J6R07_03885 [Bacteroidaceae bacterium]|nr:hypothetical protein [Bacteroidaceae bacterium]